MLHDLIDDVRAWRRRQRTRHEISRLDPRLRADIGLPETGDLDIGANSLPGARFRGRSRP